MVMPESRVLTAVWWNVAFWQRLVNVTTKRIVRVNRRGIHCFLSRKEI
jgi:hypothetical protein